MASDDIPDAKPDERLLPKDVLELLRKAPESWTKVASQSVDFDRAITLCTQAGFVEQRIRLKILSVGHPEVVRVTVTTSGNSYSDEDRGNFIQAVRGTWEGKWGALKFETESSDWRITKSGAQVRLACETGKYASILNPIPLADLSPPERGYVKVERVEVARPLRLPQDSPEIVNTVSTDDLISKLVDSLLSERIKLLAAEPDEAGPLTIDECCLVFDHGETATRKEMTRLGIKGIGGRYTIPRSKVTPQQFKLALELFSERQTRRRSKNAPK